MQLSTILRPQAVKLVSDITSKKRLMQTVADLAHDVTGHSTTEICAALLDRETLGPTGFGHGVALPHARLEGLEGVQGVFVKLDHPVEFESVDKQPVDLVFALFAPEEAGTQHLKALALVSRTLRDPALCRKLRATTDPRAIHALLTEARTSQAA